MKILIIDDDNRNIFALTAILKTRGLQALSANGMKEAFALLETEAGIGTILLDMMMPDMDGYQALSVLKSSEAWKHIPVVAVTAQAMKGDKEKCLAAGADAYVSKPVDIDQLMNVLKRS